MSKEDHKIVEEVRDKLLEHYDVVRIFVSRYDGSKSSTASCSVGGGNYYAQLGQVGEWMEMQADNRIGMPTDEDEE